MARMSGLMQKSGSRPFFSPTNSVTALPGGGKGRLSGKVKIINV